jgi:hypothetical protein
MSTLSRRHRVRSSQGETRPFVGMRTITAQAAGVDIGAHEIVACVPDGEDQQIVRTFGTYTADLQTLADWFVDRGIQTVAMESTGVYWIPLFEDWGAWLPLLPDQRPSMSAFRDARAMSSTVSGSDLAQLGLCPPRFDLTRTSWRTGRCYAIAPNFSHRAPHVLPAEALLQMPSSCRKRSAARAPPDSGPGHRRGRRDPHPWLRCAMTAAEEAGEMALAPVPGARSICLCSRKRSRFRFLHSPDQRV